MALCPEALRPTATKVKDKVMHTPMVQEGDTFVARVVVPVGTTIDNDFWIKRNEASLIWFRPSGTAIRTIKSSF